MAIIGMHAGTVYLANQLVRNLFFGEHFVFDISSVKGYNKLV